MSARVSREGPPAAGSRRTEARWFYVSVTSLVILLNVVSFAPSLIDPSTRTVPLPLASVDLVHALVAVTWLLVCLAQVTLIAAGRPAVHRRLGVVGVLLSAALIVTTWLMLVEGARRGFDLSGDLVPPGTSMDPGAFLGPANALVPGDQSGQRPGPSAPARDSRASVGGPDPPRVPLGRDWCVCLADGVLHRDRAHVRLARLRGLECSVGNRCGPT